ncbi:hypothetical protein ATHL_00489 [Anaerolinea thermolimosa]|nr:hypothetical protein ATHL_00489 [Anaerolinea thermolimosa]
MTEFEVPDPNATGLENEAQPESLRLLQESRRKLAEGGGKERVDAGHSLHARFVRGCD